MELFAKICEAVNSAHLRGIIHRDLKPGNIRIDPNGEPHLLDFGLAKIAGAASGAETGEPGLMTMTGQFLGSLPWASPEQAEGVPSKIDVRTDVYSLGVILYRMLTGQFPYDVSGNIHEVVENILKTAPTRPSTIRRQINDEVETIVLKCMAKERERRYQSAGELARDLRHYLADEPIEAKRDSAWYVLSKTLRRYRVPAAVGLLFFIVAIAFGIFMTVMYRRANAAESLAKTRLERAELSESEVRELLANSYLETARLAVRRREWQTALENYTRALQSGHADQIAIRLERVEPLARLGQIDRAADELDTLSDRSDLGRLRGPVLLWQADLAMMQVYDWLLALELLEEAIEAGLAPDDETYARALLARRTLQAVDLLKQVQGLNPNHHRARDMLAKMLLALGRLDEARVRLEVLAEYFPHDVNTKALLAVVHACRHEVAAGLAIIDALEPDVGPELADVSRGALEFIDQLNRAGARGLDSNDAKALIGTANLLLEKLLPLRKAIASAESGVTGRTNQFAFGARIPPVLTGVFASVTKGALLLTFGNVEAAATQVGSAVEVHPEGALYLFHGMLLRELGQLDEAEKTLRLAAKTPSVLDWRRIALWQAAHVQWELAGMESAAPDPVMKGRAVQSVRTLAALGRLAPQMANSAARIAIGTKEFDLARSIIADWQRWDTADPRALRLRMLVEYAAGAYGPAIQAADALLALQPDDAEALRVKKQSRQQLRSIGSGHGDPP